MFNINKKELLAIPNLLGYFRIVLIPLFAYVYLNASSIADYNLAALIVILSGITDFLDGYIARHYNMITEFGKFLDPLADKLTQAALLICVTDRFPALWYLVAIFAVKEGVMALAGVLLLRKNKKLDGALWYGKVSTAVLYVVLVVLIFVPMIDIKLANTFIAICGGLMIFAFIRYMMEYYKMWSESNQEQELE